MAMKDLVPKWTRSNRSHVPVRRETEDGLVSFQREMNRLFDDFFRGFGASPLWDWGERETALDAFSPRVDVTETGKEVRVSAELPGMDEKDVSVEVDDGAVTIRGERKEEKEDKGDTWYRKEQSYGTFHRVIPLPSAADAGKAKAKFKKGVLTVTLPKREEDQAQRRTIQIESD